MVMLLAIYLTERVTSQNRMKNFTYTMIFNEYKLDLTQKCRMMVK